MKTRHAWGAALFLAVGMAATAAEPEDVMAKASDGWPLVLLSEPLHLGDQTMKVFAHPKPDAIEVTREFVLDAKPIPLRLHIEIWVVGLLPKGDARVKKGWYQTKLSINGAEVKVLNKLIRGKKESPKVRKILVVASNRLVQEGKNTLHIKAGAQGGNYNDLELTRIAIHRTKPRL